MKKIPEFKNERDEAAFWATADSTGTWIGRRKTQEASQPKTNPEDDIASAAGLHDRGSQGTRESARRSLPVFAEGVPSAERLARERAARGKGKASRRCSYRTNKRSILDPATPVSAGTKAIPAPLRCSSPCTACPPR